MPIPAHLVTGTDLIIVSVTALIFLWDGYLLWRRGEMGTISFRMAYWATRAPIVAALGGILLGHLFWPNRAYCN